MTNKKPKDFVQTMLETLLPSVKSMLEKEKEHIEWLKKSETKFPLSFKEQIEEAQYQIDHLTNRQKEYEEFVLINWADRD